MGAIDFQRFEKEKAAGSLKGCKCNWCIGLFQTINQPDGVVMYPDTTTNWSFKIKGIPGCQLKLTFISNTLPTSKTSQTLPVKTGFNCSRCQRLNEYASSNRPDGTYICYECR